MAVAAIADGQGTKILIGHRPSSQRPCGSQSVLPQGPPPNDTTGRPRPMNFLILGDGPEERAWAAAIAGDPAHRVVAMFPGLAGVEGPKPSRDLDDALATADLDAAVVGGPVAARAEALRRAAAEGLAAVCLHPPGEDSEAYYQVALSRAETGAVIVPDLPTRLHPGVEAFRQALQGPDAGPSRAIRFESPAAPLGGDLAREAFARAVDLVRSLVGEIEAVNATGDPPGDRPSESLVAQLRAAGSRRAEVRLWAGPPEPARLILAAASGTSLTLELPHGLDGSARLLRREPGGGEAVTDFEPWDPRAAVLGVLVAAKAGTPAHPDLADGTRATEVAEAVVRSLRRGRTVELHYEEVSEAGTFKSVMTSLGCLVLLAVLALIPLALAGPALGLRWTIYLAYAIPPALVLFVALQALRFAIRDRPDLPGTAQAGFRGKPDGT
jgi:myo-inositol 2-dehydrogenase/D-chiro-inositol 1-dehydrogenase